MCAFVVFNLVMTKPCD